MNLKTSFFNTTLFKANIKRFWWVSAIYLIAFLTFAILPLMDGEHSGSIIYGFETMTVIGYLLAALLPAILFSYLDFPGSVTCMHSFPIKRKAHYITNIVTIYVLILVPAIICYIMGMLYNTIATTHFSTITLATMFLLLIIYVTIFASGGILGTMVTGNPIAAIAFSALFIGLPYYTEAIVSEFLSQNIYGMPHYELITFAGLDVKEFTTYTIVSFFVWLGVMFLSWLLYKNRPLETNGDIISFSFLKPVFIGCVSIFLGFLGYFYLTSLFEIESIFLILPFGILGIIVANMLAKKAFTLRGSFVPGVIYIVGVTLLWAVVTYDLTGYENRIPKTEDIASVYIADINNMTKYNGTPENYAGSRGGVDYYYSDPLKQSEIEFTEPEDIENVRNMHKWLVENRESKRYIYLPIIYTLKDGSTLSRRYRVNLSTADSTVFEPVYCTKQMRLNKYFIFRDFEKTINSLEITDMRLMGDDKTFKILSGNDELTAKLMEALEQDVLSASYNTIVHRNYDTFTRIEINYSRPVETIDKKTYTNAAEIFNDCITIGITSSFVRTKALLKEYGLDDRIIKREQIAYAEVYFNGNEGNNALKISDSKSVDEIYSLYADSDYNSKASTPLNENIFEVVISFYDENGKQLFGNSIDPYTADLPAFLIYEAEKWAASYYSDEPVNETEATVAMKDAGI